MSQLCLDQPLKHGQEAVRKHKRPARKNAIWCDLREVEAAFIGGVCL